MGVKVVVGTPGRLIDHIRCNTIKLYHVKVLILDEADEMLDMGFIEDIEEMMSLYNAHNNPKLARSYTAIPENH